MIRLTRPVLLHALAARAGDVAEARDEVLDQRGLADSRLARDPDHASSAAGALHALLKLREHVARPMNELACAVAACRKRIVQQAAPGVAKRPGRDEPITASRHRFDETWLAGIVPERPFGGR